MVEDLGLDNVNIVEDSKKRYSVIGQVETLNQHRDLRLALRRLPFPVNMQVVATEQLIRNAQEVFRVLGLEMQVEDLGEGRLRLYGFISDDAAMLRLVQRLADDVPGLENALMDVVQFNDVLPVATRKLQREGLAGQIEMVPHPGWIEVRGGLSLDDRLVWGRIKESLTADLGMEIPFRENFTFPGPRARAAQTKVQATTTTPRTSAGPAAVPALRIRGVSLHPAPTFITSDGLRYFIGATLPDGSVVTDITMRHIVLTRNGQRITLPTGGN